MTEFTFPVRSSLHQAEVCTHLHTMQAHTVKLCLNNTHFSQSTPTFFYPSHSVYLATLTNPSSLKPSLHYLSIPTLVYSLQHRRPSPSWPFITYSFSPHDQTTSTHTDLLYQITALCSPPHFLNSYSVPQCQSAHTPPAPHLKNIQLPPL